MNNKISIIEDLIDLIPASPFSISLDCQNEQKNTMVLSESLSFQESDDLVKEDQITLYTAELKLYLASDSELTDFDSILYLLKTFYDNLRSLEGSYYKDKYIFSVNRSGLFGFLGRDKTGLYCFSINLIVQYYI